MKKIILASNSAQRKNLLKMTGLAFTVKPSNVEEDKVITSTCAALVKKNAFLKARDIASRLKDGIVIGSDTVVYLGKKKIILKPKTLKQAKSDLKKLMVRPQWVYSGVAVINAKTGRTLIDYEKTKVFMNKLSDKEIKAYHRKVNPLDKAGGFDIEGLGSLFIHRVEGCYTNVIGMPMAKLKKMLAKFGVSILSVLLVVTAGGCTSEFNLATNQQEYHMYSTAREVKMGAKVAAKINEKLDLYHGVEEDERVREILDRIVAVCDRRDILYHIKIIDEDVVNAFALPGGFIYVFKGLIDEADTDDELASVIAHEVAHITARHNVKRLQASYGAMLTQIAATSVEHQGSAGAVSFAIASMMSTYSQEAEHEADRLSVKYLKAAGYNPNAAADFLEKLKKKNEEAGPRRFSYFKTHPNTARRIGVVRQEITGQLNFRDYLNITENEY